MQLVTIESQRVQIPRQLRLEHGVQRQRQRLSPHRATIDVFHAVEVHGVQVTPISLRQFRLLVTGKGKGAAKIEQGALANTVPHSIAVDQPVTVVTGSVLCGACFDAADEHRAKQTFPAVRGQPLFVFYVTTFANLQPPKLYHADF